MKREELFEQDTYLTLPGHEADIMQDYEDFLALKESKDKKMRVLIIYDIVNNKRRNKLAKYLSGYGFRVQKSAFEAYLSDSVYMKLLAGLHQYATNEDSIRVYKITANSEITYYGVNEDTKIEDVIII